MNPTDPPDTSTTSITTDSDDSPPPYTHLEPSCPVCGNSRFSSPEEGIPHGFDSHQVHVTCANCKTYFTIQYRPIDLSWTDGHDEQHSAVSQGRFKPTQIKYVEATMYAPLPSSTLLEKLDWPYHCDECMEPLTGNDLLSEPPDRGTDDNEEAEPPQALFECPACGHRTTHTYTENR